MNAKVLKSWSEFQGKVIEPVYKKEKADRPDLWFRGQNDASWPLQTTLDRYRTFSSNTERDSFYKALMSAFREEIVGIEPRSAIPEGDALDLLARHHGLPSSLLDWTRSPYVAAYFAFEGVIQKSEATSVAIWLCNRQRLDVGSEVDLIEDRTLLWYNRRALEQAGVFMRINTISRTTEDVLIGAVTKYEIPAKDAKIAMRYLEAMNISASTLFRDFDGAARSARIRLSI